MYTHICNLSIYLSISLSLSLYIYIYIYIYSLLSIYARSGDSTFAVPQRGGGVRKGGLEVEPITITPGLHTKIPA